MKVVCDNKIPFLPGVLEAAGIQAVYLPGHRISAADAADADALIVRTRTRCGRELLENSRVRFIATATIGFDHLDAGYLAERGIAWTNAPGCNACSVAQYVASVLAGLGLRPATVGIIGAGHVGSAVEKMLKALGIRVLLNDPPRARREGAAGFAGLEELLAECDAVTMHVPLDETTRGMAGERFFAAMKKGALFINSSRGEVVDEAALAASGVPFALDVWRNEPEIDRELLAAARLATPHIAGYSTDGKANATAAAVRSLADFFGIDALRDFRVGVLPEPEEPRFVLPEHNQVQAAILHSYDAAADCRRLRESPRDFEALRGNYPLRREFGAFTLCGASVAGRGILTELGFKLES